MTGSRRSLGTLIGTTSGHDGIAPCRGPFSSCSDACTRLIIEAVGERTRQQLDPAQHQVEFLARLVSDGGDGWRAEKFPREGAGILSSLVESDGLVELPEEMTYLEAGSLVDFLPFSEVWA